MTAKPDDKVETEVEAPHVAKVGVIDTGWGDIGCPPRT